MLQALSRHKFIALLKELKVASLNTPEGSKFHIHTDVGRNYQLKWSARKHQSYNSPRAAKAQVFELQKNEADTLAQGCALCDKSYRALNFIVHWLSFCTPKNKVHP